MIGMGEDDEEEEEGVVLFFFDLFCMVFICYGFGFWLYV